MRITEKRLKSIIRKILLETDQRTATVARPGHAAPTAFQGAYERGEVSPMHYWSNAPDHKYYPGYDFTHDQKNEAREISNMSVGDDQDKRITNWCNSNNLNIGDYIACCKEIGC